MSRPENINILVACEESQAVCIAFRERGFNAYSCDILDCSGGHPEWHIKDDVRNVIRYERWDACIAFPPCTDLAVSGAKHFEEKRKDGRQQKSIDFFLSFTKLTIPFAIENPIGIMSTHYRKPDQIIQPWMFGNKSRKATCLWLNGLPPLLPTQIVEPDIYTCKNGKTFSRDYMVALSAGKDRGKLRSKTFQGVAKAIAHQWGDFLLQSC